MTIAELNKIFSGVFNGMLEDEFKNIIEEYPGHMDPGVDKKVCDKAVEFIEEVRSVVEKYANEVDMIISYNHD